MPRQYQLTCLQVAFVILNLVAPNPAMFFGCNCGEMLPNDPYVFYNETIEITCSLKEGGKYNSSDLYIYKENSDVKTEVIDNRTIMFRKTAELGDEGTYYCHLKALRSDYDGYVAAQKLILEYAPPTLTADDLKCIVYNWGIKMECSWKLPFIKMKHIDVKLYWSNGSGVYTLCEAMTDNTKCEWDGEKTAIGVNTWNFHFKITNTHRNITETSDFTKKMKLFVKPNSVETFEPSMTNSSGYCVTLRWSFDRSYSVKPQRAGISYFSEKSQVIQLNASVDAEEYTSCDFSPNTHYNFSIRAIPAVGGYWSEPVIKVFTTEEDVPSVPPNFLPGFYDYIPSSCSDIDDSHDVKIYWQKIPLEERNGNITVYSIEYTTDKDVAKNMSVKKADVTSAMLPLNCANSYSVSVKAATQKGFSNAASSIKIPRRYELDWTPPKFIVESYPGNDQSTLFNVSWSVAPSIDPRAITSFTVQYCVKGLDSCDGEIQYERVKSSSRWLEMDNLIKDYWIGVTMENKEYSSGGTFTDCVYKKYAGPPTPINVVVKSLEDDSLTVTWAPITCNGNRPYVVRYTVYWCEVIEKTCSGTMKKGTVSSSEPMTYELKDLKKNQAYGIQVSASSRSDESSPSLMIQRTPTNSSLDEDAIAGIVVGGVFFLALCIAGCLFLIRSSLQCCKKINKELPFDFPTLNIPPDTSNNSDKKESSKSSISSDISETKGLMSGSNVYTHRQNSNDSAFGSIEGNEVSSPTRNITPPLSTVQEYSLVTNNDYQRTNSQERAGNEDESDNEENGQRSYSRIGVPDSNGPNTTVFSVNLTIQGTLSNGPNGVGTENGPSSDGNQSSDQVASSCTGDVPPYVLADQNSSKDMQSYVQAQLSSSGDMLPYVHTVTGNLRDKPQNVQSGSDSSGDMPPYVRNGPEYSEGNQSCEQAGPNSSGDMPPYVQAGPNSSGDMPPYVQAGPNSSGDMPPYVQAGPNSSGDMPPYVQAGTDSSGDMPPYVQAGPNSSGDTPPYVLAGPNSSGDMPPYVQAGTDSSGDMPPYVQAGPNSSGDMPPYVQSGPNSSGNMQPYVQAGPNSSGDMPPYIQDGPNSSGDVPPYVQAGADSAGNMPPYVGHDSSADVMPYISSAAGISDGKKPIETTTSETGDMQLTPFDASHNLTAPYSSDSLEKSASNDGYVSEARAASVMQKSAEQNMLPDTTNITVNGYVTTPC